MKGKMTGLVQSKCAKFFRLHLHYSFREKWGCLEDCFCRPLRQHSCGCSMKKPHWPERNYSGTFSWTASMIASSPLHKASLSFRGGEKKPSRYRKKFLTGPPVPSSSPAPPLFLPPLWKFSSPSLPSVSFHCRSPLLPHLVVVSVHCLTYPYFSPSPALPPSISVCPFFSSPPLLSSSPAARNFSVWSPTSASLLSLTLLAHRHNYPMATCLSPLYRISICRIRQRVIQLMDHFIYLKSVL